MKVILNICLCVLHAQEVCSSTRRDVSETEGGRAEDVSIRALVLRRDEAEPLLSVPAAQNGEGRPTDADAHSLGAHGQIGRMEEALKVQWSSGCGGGTGQTGGEHSRVCL